MVDERICELFQAKRSRLNDLLKEVLIQLAKFKSTWRVRRRHFGQYVSTRWLSLGRPYLLLMQDTLLFGTWKMRRTSFSLPERALAKWMGHCSKSNVLMLSTGLPFHSRLVMSSMAFMDYEILLIKELINVYCCWKKLDCSV